MTFELDVTVAVPLYTVAAVYPGMVWPAPARVLSLTLQTFPVPEGQGDVSPGRTFDSVWPKFFAVKVSTLITEATALPIAKHAAAAPRITFLADIIVKFNSCQYCLPWFSQVVGINS